MSIRRDVYDDLDRLVNDWLYSMRQERRLFDNVTEVKLKLGLALIADSMRLMSDAERTIFIDWIIG